MKTQEEIEQLANLFAEKVLGNTMFEPFLIKGFIDGYTQCQQDMAQQMNSVVSLAKELINSLNKQD